MSKGRSRGGVLFIEAPRFSAPTTIATSPALCPAWACIGLPAALSMKKTQVVVRQRLAAISVETPFQASAAPKMTNGSAPPPHLLQGTKKAAS